MLLLCASIYKLYPIGHPISRMFPTETLWERRRYFQERGDPSDREGKDLLDASWMNSVQGEIQPVIDHRRSGCSMCRASPRSVPTKPEDVDVQEHYVSLLVDLYVDRVSNMIKHQACNRGINTIGHKQE